MPTAILPRLHHKLELGLQGVYKQSVDLFTQRSCKGKKNLALYLALNEPATDHIQEKVIVGADPELVGDMCCFIIIGDMCCFIII